jgi:hypothetical protein
VEDEEAIPVRIECRLLASHPLAVSCRHAKSLPPILLRFPIQLDDAGRKRTSSRAWVQGAAIRAALFRGPF